MLRCEGIVLRQGGFTLRVDVEMPPGARVALMGASGSGKSTLLSLLAGFEAPDAGRVTWQGQDITHAPVAARPVSMVFQDGNLFPHLDAFANVALALRTDLRLSAQDRRAVEEALAKVGLEGLGARRPANLSGGQQSRVALARVLLQRKPLALLDEPFAALDPGLRAEMLDLLLSLSREAGLSLIMATHDIRDAERLCDRLWFLEDGDLRLDRTLAGLRDDPPEIIAPWF